VKAGSWRLSLCMLSILGGCVQGPDYVKPEVAVPSAYRFDDGPQASVEPASAQSWWGVFGDPKLDALVQEALANNRNLMIATARVDEFAAILEGTKAQGLPHVGYDLNATRARASENQIPSFVNPLSTSLSIILSASWEIDLWGRIRRETEAARANLLATDEARRGVTLTVISSVISSYLRLLELDEQKRVTQATIDGRKKSVDLFETRLKAGWVSEFEMSQVRGEYEAAQAQMPPILQAIDVEEDALSVLVGRNPGSIARAPSFEAIRSVTVPAGLPSGLLTRRPDIQQAEQQLVASNALIGAARAQFFPRISLTSLLGFCLLYTLTLPTTPYV
jgi:multidrug efflux system outer membrane protein